MMCIVDDGQLKNNLQITTLAVGGASFVGSYFSYSPEIAARYMTYFELSISTDLMWIAGRKTCRWHTNCAITKGAMSIVHTHGILCAFSGYSWILNPQTQFSIP